MYVTPNLWGYLWVSHLRPKTTDPTLTLTLCCACSAAVRRATVARPRTAYDTERSAEFNPPSPQVPDADAAQRLSHVRTPHDEDTLAATTEALNAAAAALEGAAFDYRDLSEARALIFGAAAAAAHDEEDDDFDVRPFLLLPALSAWCQTPRVACFRMFPLAESEVGVGSSRHRSLGI